MSVGPKSLTSSILPKIKTFPPSPKAKSLELIWNHCSSFIPVSLVHLQLKDCCNWFANCLKYIPFSYPVIWRKTVLTLLINVWSGLSCFLSVDTCTTQSSHKQIKQWFKTLTGKKMCAIDLLWGSNRRRSCHSTIHSRRIATTIKIVGAPVELRAISINTDWDKGQKRRLGVPAWLYSLRKWPRVGRLMLDKPKKIKQI